MDDVMDFDLLWIIQNTNDDCEYYYLDALCRAKFIPQGLTASGYFN